MKLNLEKYELKSTKCVVYHPPSSRPTADLQTLEGERQFYNIRLGCLVAYSPALLPAMSKCADCYLWMKPLGMCAGNTIQPTSRPWAHHHQDFISAFVSFIINSIHALDTWCTVGSNEKYTGEIKQKHQRNNIRKSCTLDLVSYNCPISSPLLIHPLWIKIKIHPSNWYIHFLKPFPL